MPKKKELTKEELAAIQKRHDEMVAKFNSILPDNLKIKPTNMADALKDPKAVSAYQIANEVKQKRDKQNEIAQRLTGESIDNFRQRGHYPFYAKFRTDGTKESEKYNQDIVNNFNQGGANQQYFQGFRKVLEASAKELYECGNDPEKLAEFYRNNYELCENAHMMSQMIKGNAYDSNVFNKEFRQHLPSMEALIDLVAYPRDVTLNNATMTDVAFPKLNQEQIQYLYQRYPSIEDNEALEHLRKEANGFGPSPKEYMDKFEEAHHFKMTDHDDFVSRYELYAIDDNQNRIYYPLEEYMNPNPDPNRPAGLWFQNNEKNNRHEVDCINNFPKEKYLEKWGEAFNRRRFGHENEKFDLSLIERQNRGGWWERKVFKSTSQEYKNMIQALKDYHNPESEHYMDDDNLRNSAEAYREHQRRQGYDNGKTLKGTGLERRHIANAIIDTLNEKDKLFKKAFEECKKPSVEEPKLADADLGLNDLFTEELKDAVDLDKANEPVQEKVEEKDAIEPQELEP